MSSDSSLGNYILSVSHVDLTLYGMALIGLAQSLGFLTNALLDPHPHVYPYQPPLCRAITFLTPLPTQGLGNFECFGVLDPTQHKNDHFAPVALLQLFRPLINLGCSPSPLVLTRKPPVHLYPTSVSLWAFKCLSLVSWSFNYRTVHQSLNIFLSPPPSPTQCTK